MSNGGSSSWISACSRRTRRASTRIHRLRARAPDRRRRTAPTSSARSNRSGIRRCSRSRAACRRRSRRGGTTRRPSACCLDVRAQLRRLALAARRRTASSPRSRATSANCLSTSYRKKPSQTLSPLPCCRPGSCRRSSRRSPSAAGRARRSAGRARSRARNARRASRDFVGAARQVVVRLLLRVDRRGLRGTARVSSSTPVSPVALT